jgi:hypothetical protein
VMQTAATIIGRNFTEPLPWRLRGKPAVPQSVNRLAVLLHLIILLGWVGLGAASRCACWSLGSVPI